MLKLGVNTNNGGDSSDIEILTSNLRLPPFDGKIY